MSLNVVKRKLEISILILSEITDLFIKSFCEVSKSLIKGVYIIGISGLINFPVVLYYEPYYLENHSKTKCK